MVEIKNYYKGLYLNFDHVTIRKLSVRRSAGCAIYIEDCSFLTIYTLHTPSLDYAIQYNENEGLTPDKHIVWVKSTNSNVYEVTPKILNLNPESSVEKTTELIFIDPDQTRVCVPHVKITGISWDTDPLPISNDLSGHISGTKVIILDGSRWFLHSTTAPKQLYYETSGVIEASNDDWITHSLVGNPTLVTLTINETDANYCLQLKATNSTHFQIYLYDLTASNLETVDKTINWYAEYQP